MTNPKRTRLQQTIIVIGPNQTVKIFKSSRSLSYNVALITVQSSLLQTVYKAILVLTISSRYRNGIRFFRKFSNSKIKVEVMNEAVSLCTRTAVFSYYLSKQGNCMKGQSSMIKQSSVYKRSYQNRSGECHNLRY